MQKNKLIIILLVLNALLLGTLTVAVVFNKSDKHVEETSNLKDSVLNVESEPKNEEPKELIIKGAGDTTYNKVNESWTTELINNSNLKVELTHVNYFINDEGYPDDTRIKKDLSKEESIKFIKSLSKCSAVYIINMYGGGVEPEYEASISYTKDNKKYSLKIYDIAPISMDKSVIEFDNDLHNKLSNAYSKVYIKSTSEPGPAGSVLKFDESCVKSTVSSFMN